MKLRVHNSIDSRERFSAIIDGGYCIGCGTCSFMSPASIEIVEDKFQQYQAQIRNNPNLDDLDNSLRVCPFSNEGLNESELANQLFSRDECSISEYIGFYQSSYGGHVAVGDYRNRCTSGGIVSWLLIQLLDRDMVDAVVHVKKSEKEGVLFEYGLSSSATEVIEGAKSRYYPVEVSQIMEFIRQNEGRYVFVGLPCFVKAVRNLSIENSVIGSRIKYVVGLVCGHLKSKAFSDLFALQAGIGPGEIVDIDFRVENKGKSAGEYGVSVKGPDEVGTILRAKECFGTDWGYNFFKYEACDYCDDVFAETADLVVGDAWLPEYAIDSRGDSIVVTRNSELDAIVSEGRGNGILCLDMLSEDRVCRSQAGGIRHRRSGLSYRIYLRNKKGSWVPKKRVEPSNSEQSLSRKAVYRYRMYLRKISAELWLKVVREKNLNILVKGTRIHLWLYRRLLTPFNVQVSNWARKIAKNTGIFPERGK